MTIVVFQSVTRIAVTVLVPLPISANASQDMAARHATSVSYLQFHDNDGTPNKVLSVKSIVVCYVQLIRIISYEQVVRRVNGVQTARWTASAERVIHLMANVYVPAGGSASTATKSVLLIATDSTAPRSVIAKTVEAAITSLASATALPVTPDRCELQVLFYRLYYNRITIIPEGFYCKKKSKDAKFGCQRSL